MFMLFRYLKHSPQAISSTHNPEAFLPMSCSKPLPPFTFDVLYYLNRDQFERLSIVCRPLKNFINRYFHSKPYRIFDRLEIHGRSYVLRRYVPGGYIEHKFLAGEKRSITKMRLCLGLTVRVKRTFIFIAGDSTYSPEQVKEMESMAHLWRDGKIEILKAGTFRSRIVAEDFPMILNSPTILQCRFLKMDNAHFSFKDYKVLKTMNTIDVNYCYKEIDPDHWIQFLEQPGLKPVVVFRQLHNKNTDNVLNHLCKAFSAAVSPNAYKIVIMFVKYDNALTEFRKTNKTSGEKLDLKKGIPEEYQNEYHCTYTLERSSI